MNHLAHQTPKNKMSAIMEASIGGVLVAHSTACGVNTCLCDDIIVAQSLPCPDSIAPGT